MLLQSIVGVHNRTAACKQSVVPCELFSLDDQDGRAQNFSSRSTCFMVIERSSLSAFESLATMRLCGQHDVHIPAVG